MGGFEQPTAIVEVINNFVAVTFLDTLFRMEQTLKFQEREPKRLFMSMATHRVFCEATDAMVARMEAGRKNPDQPWAQFLADSDRVVKGTSLSFKQKNEVLKIYEHFAVPYHLEKSTFEIDCSGFWEPYPDFGKYEHLLKIRELPWGDELNDD